MHSLEMLQRMNSATVSGRIRRRAIILNKGGGHAKDAEKGRPMKKNRAGGWVVPDNNPED